MEVDTPQGVRVGSSVYEVWANSKTSLLPEEAKRAWGVKGEAVAVDLPSGRTLFALLTTNADHQDLAGLSMSALDPAYRNDVVESARRIAGGQGTKKEAVVSPADYPMLVTFREQGTPRSVEAIDPSDLASHFGAGYKLRRITVQITSDSVTSGIKNRFSWWQDYERRHFDGTPTISENLMSNDLAAHLSTGSLSTEAGNE